jgi:hypothetical protein
MLHPALRRATFLHCGTMAARFSRRFKHVFALQ